MISFDLPGCRFLDLFAGSGAIGMEALSRGAEQAVFVENAVPCQDVIARNLAHTKLGEGARVLCMEASAALDRLAEAARRIEAELVGLIEENGGRIRRYGSFEEFAAHRGC